MERTSGSMSNETKYWHAVAKASDMTLDLYVQTDDVAVQTDLGEAKEERHSLIESERRNEIFPRDPEEEECDHRDLARGAFAEFINEQYGAEWELRLDEVEEIPDGLEKWNSGKLPGRSEHLVTVHYKETILPNSPRA